MGRLDETKSIIVVEDDHDTRVSIRTSLEAAGYNVLSAANGALALEILEEGATPNLMLVDLAMPIMNGEVFLKRVAADSRLRKIPVVIISAYTEEARRFPKNFLSKPFGLAGLLGKVQKGLANS